MIAKKTQFNLGDMKFEASGTYDPSALILRGGKQREAADQLPPTHFETVTVNAEVQTTEPDEKFKEFVDYVERICPVSSLMRAAKVNIKANWKKV